MKKTVKVVGAIIENSKREILCALRSPKMVLGNLWEFPGGKLEEGEDIAAAIIREIKEELKCDIEFISKFHHNIHEYENIIVDFTTAKCKIINGEPKAYEHSKLTWLPIENLTSLQWAPADIPSVDKLLESLKVSN